MSLLEHFFCHCFTKINNCKCDNKANAFMTKWNQRRRSKTLFVLWLWKCFTVAQAHVLKHSLRKFNKIKIVVQVRTYLIVINDTTLHHRNHHLCHGRVQMGWNWIQIEILVLSSTIFCTLALRDGFAIKNIICVKNIKRVVISSLVQ